MFFGSFSFVDAPETFTTRKIIGRFCSNLSHSHFQARLSLAETDLFNIGEDASGGVALRKERWPMARHHCQARQKIFVGWNLFLVGICGKNSRFLKFFFVFKFDIFLCIVRDSTTNKPSELTWSWHPLACLPKLPLIRHSAGWDSGQSIILLPQSQQHLCLYEPWTQSSEVGSTGLSDPRQYDHMNPYELKVVTSYTSINLRYLNVEFLGCKLNSDFDGIMKRIVWWKNLGIASLQPLAFSHLHCVWGILVAFRMWIWNLTDLMMSFIRFKTCTKTQNQVDWEWC